MARKKEMVLSQAEVEYVANSVMANCLRNASLALLGSGATPSGEVGRIIMHLSNGANENNRLAREVGDKLYANAASAASGGDSAADERLQWLEQIINGKAK